MRRQHFNEVLKGWEFLISLKGNQSERVVISHNTNLLWSIQQKRCQEHSSQTVGWNVSHWRKLVT